MAEDNSSIINPDDLIPDDVKKNPDWILSKVLFERFGILHDFHIFQLKCYMVACSRISIGGEVRIDPDNKSVVFNLYTSKNYTTEDGKPVRRKRFSFKRLFGISRSNYRQEIKIAKSNLRKWTQRLLWPNTSIEINVDGEKNG